MKKEQVFQPSTNSEIKPPTVDPSLPTEKSNNWLIIVLTIITIFSLGIAGIFAWENTQLKKGFNKLSLTQEKRIQPTESPTKTPSLTQEKGIQPTESPTKTPSMPTEQPTTSTIEVIPALSTNNWKKVSLNNIYFKIPSDAKCFKSGDLENENINNCELIYVAGAKYMPSMRISVENYLGGSRRKQLCENEIRDGEIYNYCPECRAIYKEAYFGDIKALQIAIDGGWCQGGGGGIVAVIGNKLVIFHNLFYDFETKKINRWDIRDTVISTLSES